MCISPIKEKRQDTGFLAENLREREGFKSVLRETVWIIG